MGERKLMAKMSDQELQAQAFVNQENISILQQEVNAIRNQLGERAVLRSQKAADEQAKKQNGNGQTSDKSLKSAMKKALSV